MTPSRTGGAVTMLVAAAMAAGAALATARGEQSYALPEVRESPAPPGQTGEAFWSSAIDPPDLSGHVLAIGPGVVAFATAGRVCGFNSGDGTRRWCSEGSAPAYAAGVVAFTDGSGDVTAVDARTGARVWGGAGDASTFGLAPVVFAAGDDFLVAVHRDDPGFGTIVYSDLAPTGARRWTADGIAGSIEGYMYAPPFALVRVTGAGATIWSSEQAIRPGHGGGVTGTFANAWEMADVRGPSGVISGDWVTEEVEDRFLTSDLETVDLGSGKIVVRHHYEPDYDDNRALWDRGLAPSVGYQSGPRSDAEYAYVSVRPKLYRYRLTGDDSQRPLLVASDVVFLGGPYKGALYAQRADGVWSFRIEKTQVRSRLVARSAVAATAIAADGDTVCFGFGDGDVRCIDAGTGRSKLDSSTSIVPSRIAVTPHEIFVVGQADRSWRVVAYGMP